MTVDTCGKPYLPTLHIAFKAHTMSAEGLCRKFAFETICAMVSPGDLQCTERENDDGDQFQGSSLSAGY